MKIYFVTLLLVTICSCSSNRSVETVETSRVDPRTSETVETTRTESVRNSDNDSCGGILSCTVDFVGDVIAFPFRLVGGVVEAIF